MTYYPDAAYTFQLEDILYRSFEAKYDDDNSSTKGVIIRRGHLDGVFSFIPNNVYNKRNPVLSFSLFAKDDGGYYFPEDAEATEITFDVPVSEECMQIAIKETINNID